MAAAYFASDVHLRLDAPERATRFAGFVETLTPDSSLTIVGDLCDFWFVARQTHSDPFRCPGLRSLAEFRSRGGQLSILAGNHDAALIQHYQRWLDAQILSDSCLKTVHGHRVRLAHGHKLGARRLWKAGLETRAFANAFSILPARTARWFEGLNDGENLRSKEANDRRHLDVYRRFAAEHADAADLVVLGHIHRIVEEEVAGVRLFVLGNWHQGSSYLRLDDGGIQFTRVVS